MLDQAPPATQLGTTSLSQETAIESLPVEGQRIHGQFFEEMPMGARESRTGMVR